MIISVAGEPTFISTGGQEIDAAKPAVMLLHGAGLDHSVWTLQARYLAHHGRSVIVPDLPGHGRSGGAALDTVPALADWCWHLLEQLDLRRVSLAGHSLGGLIALTMAAARPDAMRSLLLLGVAAEMPVHPDLLAAARDDRDLAAALIAMWGFGRSGQIGGNVAPGLQMRIAGQRLLERAKPGVLAADLTACAAYRDGVAAAAALRCPTALLLGLEDRMTPASKGKHLAAQMKDVPDGAGITILPGCGHMIMAERPNDTIAVMKRVL
ncbi:MAG: alpha/beta fold hydrolase [Dongiaceae bacterium]